MRTKTSKKATRKEIAKLCDVIISAALNIHDHVDYNTLESSYAEQITELAHKLENTLEDDQE